MPKVFMTDTTRQMNSAFRNTDCAVGSSCA